MLPTPYPGGGDFETGKKLPEVTLTAVWTGMHYNAMYVSITIFFG